MTEHCQGTLIYTPDGYISVHILNPGQKSFNITGSGVDDAQWAESAKRYLAYSGPFYITEEDGKGEVLRHDMQVSNRPAWVGEVQQRTWDFEEDGKVLILSVDEPVDMQGEKRIPELRWRKLEDNSQNRAPPERA
ncbi:MAG: hypothetical protein M1821_006133 [Bathelium mastoideum]|nr:MAG: hypothetical protein M1821_006133 [Bathelium mastoideum]KAI9688335.1 MAG: hypothetical protein M1822_001283 [Bathelium mastoideum]